VVRFAKIVVALLCIACVVALCVAPYVDIPVTVLKSVQVVLLLMLTMVAGALLLGGLFHQVLARCAVIRSDRTAFIRSLIPPLETNCVQQC
jgi:Na+/H+ antiporter NhaD/arsenite permease-like protein